MKTSDALVRRGHLLVHPNAIPFKQALLKTLKVEHLPVSGLSQHVCMQITTTFKEPCVANKLSAIRYLPEWVYQLYEIFGIPANAVTISNVRPDDWMCRDRIVRGVIVTNVTAVMEGMSSVAQSYMRLDDIWPEDKE